MLLWFQDKREKASILGTIRSTLAKQCGTVLYIDIQDAWLAV
jgi:hypothetical protein